MKTLLQKIPAIAPEGRDIVSIAALAALAASAFFGWGSLPFWLALLFALQFFRDPERAIPEDAEDVALSPADGRVVFVGPSVSPADDSPSLKISVFMNVFNVHANRIPTDGTVAKSERFPGAFVNAALDKASEKNERHLIALDTPHGPVACVQIAGLIARRISCDAKVGETVSAGTRYGFIRFGSRADLHLPPSAIPLAALGDKVVAGQTPLARFAPERESSEQVSFPKSGTASGTESESGKSSEPPESPESESS